MNRQISPGKAEGGWPVCAAAILASLHVELATRKRETSVGGSGGDNVVAGCIVKKRKTS